MMDISPFSQLHFIVTQVVDTWRLMLSAPNPQCHAYADITPGLRLQGNVFQDQIKSIVGWYQIIQIIPPSCDKWEK